MTLRFGSVCSGIEAASTAWNPLGWEAAWLSEIEPFPSAVLAHHYPDVPNLGDMTLLPDRIANGEVEAPDLFCGGTPCQAFSVAGLRKSLDDARGNLSLVFCEIANAIDTQRAGRNQPPAIIFWENVPGVLSTKDNAFGCFLAGLAGEEDPVEPPRGKWTNAGVVLGPQRAVAWRILDAQYFGVAQRRRRVFVVASARDDFDPASILFEFDGVRRDTAPSREAGKVAAPCVTNGPPFSRTGNERVEAEAMVVAARMVAFGEYSVDGTASAMKARDYKDATDLVAQPMVVHGTQDPCVSNIAFAQGRNNGGENVLAYTTKMHNTTSNQAGKFYEEYSTSLDANSPPPAVFQPIPINSMNALRSADADKTTGCGIGEAGDPSFTLTKGHSHAVAHVVGALACNTGPNGHDAGNFACNQAVDAGHVLPVAQPMVLMDQGGSVMNVEHNMVGTLRRETHGHEPAVIQPPSMAVRRLTPVECERLQGFPDDYTQIPWRKKPADECPDGPRYKALGNSWAVPVVAWIGRRIHNAVLAAKRMEKEAA